MKKSKVIGIALALALTVLPGVNSFVPFSATSDAVSVSAALSCGTYKVTTKTDPLRLRTGPSTNYGVIINMPKDSWVVSTGEEQYGWLKVSYMGPGGTVYTGWAYSGYLTWYYGGKY